MFGSTFYHGTIRKSVVIFGTLFNNISVSKFDSGGNITSTIPIPLSYGPREKYLTRIDSIDNPLVMPRMSFELIDLTYDPERRLGKTDTIRKEIVEDGNTKKLVFNPVPYNLNFQLSAMVKNTDDGIQIVEQILPYFAPSFSLNFNIIPEMEISKDIVIVLNSLSNTDTYEGDYDTRRVLEWTFDFSFKTYLYGPVKERGVITSTLARVEQAGDTDDSFGFDE